MLSDFGQRLVWRKAIDPNCNGFYFISTQLAAHGHCGFLLMGDELVEQTLLSIARTDHRAVGTAPQSGQSSAQVEASPLHRVAVANKAVPVEERKYLILERSVDSLQLGLVSTSALKGLGAVHGEVHKQREPSHHADDQGF